MSDDQGRSGSGKTSGGAQHTPEEQAAFEERLRTVDGFRNLAREAVVAEEIAMDDEMKAAEDAGASHGTLDRMREGHSSRMNALLWTLVLLAVVLIVLVALWLSRGQDLTADLDGGSFSSAVSDIAPPTPADTPEDVLPAAVFEYECADCGGTTVVQTPLNLNKDAKYQFAYEAGSSRIAIFTVVDASEYDSMADSLQAEYEKAQEKGEEAAAPKMFDDIGEGAVIYGATAVFKNGDDCGLLWANTLQDAGGEQSVTIKPDELERLVRIAAPRM